MSKAHYYHSHIRWEGNLGNGTAAQDSYSRNFIAKVAGKGDLKASADSAFQGDGGRWNPEDMLLTAVAAGHKLRYLHLCALNKVKVLAYSDLAEAMMDEGDPQRPGHFCYVRLSPQVVIDANSSPELALALHEEASRLCFMANSLNCPVRCEPKISQEKAA